MIQCQIHMSFTVAENTESVDNPLHDAAKRGNIEFMNECLTNRVSLSVTTYTNCYSGLSNESTGTHPKTWPKMQACTLIRVIL